MIVAHVLGVPVEESVLQLAPVGATVVTAAAIFGRSRLETIVKRLLPRGDKPMRRSV